MLSNLFPVYSNSNYLETLREFEWGPVSVGTSAEGWIMTLMLSQTRGGFLDVTIRKWLPAVLDLSAQRRLLAVERYCTYQPLCAAALGDRGHMLCAAAFGDRGPYGPYGQQLPLIFNCE